MAVCARQLLTDHVARCPCTFNNSTFALYADKNDVVYTCHENLIIIISHSLMQLQPVTALIKCNFKLRFTLQSNTLIYFHLIRCQQLHWNLQKRSLP